MYISISNDLCEIERVRTPKFYKTRAIVIEFLYTSLMRRLRRHVWCFKFKKTAFNAIGHGLHFL